MIFFDVQVSELHEIANKVLKKFPEERIFVFDAVMGAGKTSFITKFCNILGVDNQVASPTFAIINAYMSKFGNEIYHFDFYRLNKIEDAFEIGFYEYLESGNYCFIEWPNLIYPYLPNKYVKIKILQKNSADLRDIEVNLNFS
ncbi:MAG: tRNA (adenosine(37)-N6)-threonylcarbamoyltransferase complex ATPase subunit type 1 TsaE [Bacteroidetes bacterium CG2_30_33_31]|nr:MAG: tRNA (adenosine(37)-N6)-threonylcarbamoyltransferase complex ATPase subunit type 1 TsaE [Bacteroidetes bacterium CG2_30_33_31]